MALLPIIERSRLVEYVLDPSARVVKLIAPAGYGKTSLVNAVLANHENHAVIDLSRTTTRLEFFRQLILAMVRTREESSRADVSEQMNGLGDDEPAWRDMAARLLAASPSAFILHFENAESVDGKPDLQREAEQLVTNLPPDARIFVCSRSNVFRFGRFAGPDRSRVLTARDLRFSVDETRLIFDSLRISRNEYAAIEKFAKGWPIVVMMLFSLARRGRLTAYLEQPHDTADLYTYLASEVMGALPPVQGTMLEALAAIPDARASELALLFPDANIAGTLASLQDGTPFITVADGRINVHPALREMLAGRCDLDAYRARLFTSLFHVDGGFRAAEIALLRDRPRDAARAMVENKSYGGWWIPSQAEVLGALPEDVLNEFPALWGSASYFRAAHNIMGMIETGLRLLANLPDDSPPEGRIELLSMVALGLANQGDLVRAQELVDALLSHPTLVGRADAAGSNAVLGAIIRLYRGDPVDFEAYQRMLAPMFATSAFQQTFWETMLVAEYRRAHGDEEADRAAIERGVDISRGTAPHAMCYAETYGAMSAWFWGDDERFEQHVARLESVTTPLFRGSFSHFIDCSRGRGLSAVHGSEKMDMRTYGYAIACAKASKRSDRLRLSRATLAAAERSSRRFCRILALVIGALCDRRGWGTNLDRAERLAREMESVPLERAIAALRLGDASGTMLEALVARFDPVVPEQHKPAVSLDLREGVVHFAGACVPVSARELEVLLYLATRPTAADVATIRTSLWPESDDARRAVSLRVTVNRLRKRLNDPRIIVFDRGRYSIGLPIVFENLPDVWPPPFAAKYPWRDRVDLRRVALQSSIVLPNRIARL